MNRTAENLYGYSPEEALGQDVIRFLIDPQDSSVANNVVDNVTMGEIWTGQIPVKSKRGDRFSAIVTCTLFSDDDGSLIGVICVSNDMQPFHDSRAPLSESRHSEGDSGLTQLKNTATSKLGLDSQHPLQVAIASKLSNLASKVSDKVRRKIRIGDYSDRDSEFCDANQSDPGFSDDQREDAASSGASTLKGDLPPHSFSASHQSEDNSLRKISRDSVDEGGKPPIHKLITSKAEAWMGKKGLSWPWKGNEQDESENKSIHSGVSWLHNDQDNESYRQKTSPVVTSDHQRNENNCSRNDAPGSRSSANVNSTSSASSCGSTSSSTMNKVDMDSDCLDYEILYEDLTIVEQVGQGSCGTVYHALWYGSWKFVSFTTEEHGKVGLEKACTYGFGYSKRHELVASLQSTHCSS